MSPAPVCGLEQHTQPSLQCAASSSSTSEDTIRRAWQDACVASELRRTCTAAALCQTALIAGKGDIMKAGCSWNGSGPPKEPSSKLPDAPGVSGAFASAVAAVCGVSEVDQQIVTWHPAMQTESRSGTWDNAVAAGCSQEHAENAGTDRLPSAGFPSLGSLSSLLAGSSKSRTLFVDSWLMQNKALVARL